MTVAHSFGVRGSDRHHARAGQAWCRYNQIAAACIPALRASCARLGVSCRSGVPLRTERWFIAYCPVRIEARDGPQGLVTEIMAAETLTASSMKRRAGSADRHDAASDPCSRSARSWSIRMNSTFLDVAPSRHVPYLQGEALCLRQVRFRSSSCQWWHDTAWPSSQVSSGGSSRLQMSVAKRASGVELAARRLVGGRGDLTFELLRGAAVIGIK